MSVKIRLARGGAKKRPYYRIVVADIRSPRDGRYIERVGSYNPLVPKDHDERITLDNDRIIHWLSQGAKPTDRVARFLDEAGILKREPRNNPQKAKPKKEPVEKPEVAPAPAAEEAPAPAAEEAPAPAAEEAPAPAAEEAPAPAAEEAPAPAAEEAPAPAAEEAPAPAAETPSDTEDK